MTKDPEKLKQELIDLWKYGYAQQQMIRNKSLEIYYQNYAVFAALRVGSDALVNLLDDIKELIEKEDE